MSFSFGTVTELPRGTLCRLLADAYFFAPPAVRNTGLRNDGSLMIFFDNPEVAETCGFITRWNWEGDRVRVMGTGKSRIFSIISIS